MPPAIHTTVAAVVERDGRFLLVEERVDGRLVINQPAGHLEAGESLIDAAVRETLEETGHHFHPDYLVGIYRWQQQDGDTFVRFAFAGNADEDSGQALDPDIERVIWRDPLQLEREPSRLRSPLVLAVIRDYRSGQRFPLDCLQDVVSATL